MRYVYAIAVAALALSACSSNTVKDTLGLERSAPDEFRVVSRPPLSVPPQFTLRPPATSEETPNQLPASQQAKSLVTGAPADNGGGLRPGSADTAVMPVTVGKPAPASGSRAESTLLQHAGADQADPQVREKILEERIASGQEQPEDCSWWDIFCATPPKKDPVVNAAKETDRIQKNADEGKPVTTGDTPDVKESDHGVLGKIFGY